MNESFWSMVWVMLEKYWPWFLRGTGITLMLALVGTLAGFVIGLLIGIITTIPEHRGGEKTVTLRFLILKTVKAILAVYVEVLRGTPMMVQAILIYYGLKEAFNIDIAALPAGFLVISLNTGAYMAEIVRGGIQSVPSGQTEAAKAIGMTHWKTMVNVVLPQAIRNILPTCGNEFIINIKDSSVLNVITVGELFFVTSTIKGIYLRTYETFFISAVIYLLLTFTTTRILRALEKKMDGPDSYTMLDSADKSKTAAGTTASL